MQSSINMKYFLATLSISLALFLGTGFANASTGVVPNAAIQQATAPQYDCSIVDSYSLYVNCCTQSGAGTSEECVNYEDQYLNPNNTLPDTVQGGTPSTTAVNTANTALGTSAVSSAASDQKALQSCTAIKFNTILDIAIWVKCLIGVIVIPGIFTLAFVVFLWGVFKFIRASEQKDKDEGKQFIYMGLIGLFVMTSVWGILKIFSNTLGIDSTVPTLQTDYLSTGKASTSTTTNTAPTSVSTGSTN